MVESLKALNYYMQVMEVNHRVIDHDIIVFVVVVELVLINEDQQDEKNQVMVHHVVELDQYKHLEKN
jgi:hypothetical protein